MICNHNGKFIEGENINISTHNRALNYGDGVFETIKYANRRLNFWEDHYFRLMASMRILRMEIPMSFSPEFLEELIRNTIRENGLEEAAVRVRFTVYRKAGGLYTPHSNEIDFLITLSRLEEHSFTLNESGLNIDLYRDFYVQQSLLSTIKSLNANLYTIASIFKKENNLDECILLNDKKMVVEAISANLFMLKNKVVYTPPLSDGCLKGVMRKQVIELLREMDFEVREESFSPFEIQKAEELFLTNSIKGIQWVHQYKKKSFEKSLSEQLVKRLNVKVALG